MEGKLLSTYSNIKKSAHTPMTSTSVTKKTLICFAMMILPPQKNLFLPGGGGVSILGGGRGRGGG